MREQQFANWLGKQVKSTGEPYAESTITSYIRYLGSIEQQLGNIDNVPLANAEAYLEQVKTSFPDLEKHTAVSYSSGATMYFDFRKEEEQISHH